MKTFNQKLRETIQQRNSLVCVGLDTRPDQMPAPLEGADDAVVQFNHAIIDATAEYTAAYKPNLAFYEALGEVGYDTLKRTLAHIPEGILTIGDAKRGDIGATAVKYAKALYDLGFDSVTINPYMGLDAVKPFIENPEKGVFILCLTSNPSSKDLQYLQVDRRPLYEHVAEKIASWNDNDNCGLVVGATHPEELQTIRSIVGDLPILIPGIGAQGGDLEGAIQYGTDARGEMALVNSSRGILYASAGDNFAEAAAGEARKLRDDINTIRKQKA